MITKKEVLESMGYKDPVEVSLEEIEELIVAAAKEGKYETKYTFNSEMSEWQKVCVIEELTERDFFVEYEVYFNKEENAYNFNYGTLKVSWPVRGE